TATRECGSDLSSADLRPTASSSSPGRSATPSWTPACPPATHPSGHSCTTASSRCSHSGGPAPTRKVGPMTEPQRAQSADAALLVLEDGTTYRGRAYGSRGSTTGEMVFTTGMSGYQETLTDPSYHRQIVVMTAPHIGNTGVNTEDTESGGIQVAGFVVRDPARRSSSWRATGDLVDDLTDQGIVGISHLDTRALTRRLRDGGV